jgi:cysteine desulfurase / selenocysteine lyase
MNLAEYKNSFFQKKHVHLNNGGLSPISRPVFDEINYWTKRFFEDGFHSDFDYKQRMEWSRSQVAKLIDCESEEVAFFQSCAWGITQFAFGIDLKKDDEILLYDQEYSSNLYPWQAACKKADAQLIFLESGPNLEMSVDQIAAKITTKTKLITISWVQYQTGAIINLKELSELCQAKNILLFVDATQGLGIHPLSFKDLSIDGLASASHKWLNAPVGVGFLAIKKSLALKMNPIGYGALTYGECDDPSVLECKPKLNALKFEPGAKQVLEINGLGKAIEIINTVGTDILKAEAFRHAKILRDGISNLGFKIHSPFKNSDESQFICFSGQNDNQVIKKYFHDLGIHLPIRGPGVRVTPHALNSNEDIDFFLQALKKIS